MGHYSNTRSDDCHANKWKVTSRECQSRNLLCISFFWLLLLPRYPQHLVIIHWLIFGKKSFGFWLALTVLPSSQFEQDYQIQDDLIFSAQKGKCFFLHKYFLLCSDDKDIPTHKTMVTYSYCFYIVSGKCVSHYKVQKRLKMEVAFETLFLFTKPNG